jgi:hypothetical protein
MMLFVAINCAGFKNIDFGFDNLDGRIISIGDFNGDRNNDLVMLNTAQTELSILYWTESNYK